VTPPLWDEGVADPLKQLPHMCYHVKFVRFASKGVCRNGTQLQIIGQLWAPPPLVGAWLSPESMPLPMCYTAEIGLSRSIGTSIIQEIHRNLTLCILPLKVIRTDTD